MELSWLFRIGFYQTSEFLEIRVFFVVPVDGDPCLSIWASILESEGGAYRNGVVSGWISPDNSGTGCETFALFE